MLEPGVQTGMPILYDNPKEVGADRIANAVGAYDLYGGPTIVVDFGTATTFDAISADGRVPRRRHRPGHRHQPRRPVPARPPRCAGSSWSSPAASSARRRSSRSSPAPLYGFAAQVDGLCRRIKDELGHVHGRGHRRPGRLIIAPLSQTIEHHEPWLTLHGLRLVYERNVNRHDGGVGATAGDR